MLNWVHVSKMVETAASRVDFAMAEALAFGTLALHRSFRPPGQQPPEAASASSPAAEPAPSPAVAEQSATESPQVCFHSILSRSQCPSCMWHEHSLVSCSATWLPSLEHDRRSMSWTALQRWPAGLSCSRLTQHT